MILNPRCTLELLGKFVKLQMIMKCSWGWEPYSKWIYQNRNSQTGVTELQRKMNLFLFLPPCTSFSFYFSPLPHQVFFMFFLGGVFCFVFLNREHYPNVYLFSEGLEEKGMVKNEDRTDVGVSRDNITMN